MTKQHILSEIRKSSRGKRRCAARPRTVREGNWYQGILLAGKVWATWGDAVREAGFAVNPWNAAHPEEYLLASYAALVRELGHVPTTPQLRMKRRADSTFPSDKTFTRFGDKSALLARLWKFCEGRPEVADVLAILGTPTPNAISARTRYAMPIGFVYLTKFGRHFKIGRTNAVGRRERELAIQLPEKSRTVHVIETDDPEGIEVYWHRRFATKRGNGEWFALDTVDVAAFKRRRFM